MKKMEKGKVSLSLSLEKLRELTPRELVGAVGAAGCGKSSQPASLNTCADAKTC